MQSDSDEKSQVEWHEARPLPCPECSSTKGYSRVGKFRSQCLNCNALLKNAEINRENLDPQ
jgi:ribosomal protein L37AE/L43A